MNTTAEITQTKLPWLPVALASGLFLAISYVVCVVFDILIPVAAMHAAWAPLLPGFTWISWGSFFLGLLETLLYGFWIAVIFCPLYNYFAPKFSR